MIGWTGVLLACLAVFAIKLTGHLAPERLLQRPAVVRGAGLLTAGLLAALVGIQALTTGDRIVLDARVPALGVAAIALWFRAPFVVVVLLAALAAAGLRALGLP